MPPAETRGVGFLENRCWPIQRNSHAKADPILIEGRNLTVRDFDEALDHYHMALREFAKGNSESLTKLFSHRGDVTVSGGFGGYFRGWEQVEKNTEMAASLFIDGVVTGFENVSKYATPELGYAVDIERFNAQLAGTEDIVPVALRVTSIFRREEGAWRLVHRHGDPITSVRPADSIVPKRVSHQRTG